MKRESRAWLGALQVGMSAAAALSCSRKPVALFPQLLNLLYARPSPLTAREGQVMGCVVKHMFAASLGRHVGAVPSGALSNMMFDFNI